MFEWLTPKKTVSDVPTAAAIEEAPAPVVRTPQHAKRDALMSVAVGGDKYKTMIDAHKLAPKNISIGTTAMKGQGKGKMPASPLAMDSGLPSRNTSAMFSQPEPAPEPKPKPKPEPVSHKTSARELEIDGELDELWEIASRALGQDQSTESISPAESSTDAQKAAKKADGADGAA